MSKITGSLSKFAQATIAFLKGDTDTVIALRNERLAASAIKGQLSALEGALVEAEVNVENAKENLEKAVYPAVAISNQSAYYKGIITAQESLTDSEDKLSDIKKSIDYANRLLKDKF